VAIRGAGGEGGNKSSAARGGIASAAAQAATNPEEKAVADDARNRLRAAEKRIPRCDSTGYLLMKFMCLFSPSHLLFKYGCTRIGDPSINAFSQDGFYDAVPQTKRAPANSFSGYRSKRFCKVLSH
jgi:hypothetical protein